MHSFLSLFLLLTSCGEKQHFVYPAPVNGKQERGWVMAQFVVEKDGSFTNVSALSSDSEILSDAVREMLAQMPQWIAAKDYKQPVRSQKILNSYFSLKAE